MFFQNLPSLPPIPGVVERIQANRPQTATAATVWNEVLYGYYRMPESRRKRVLEEYLLGTLALHLKVLPYDDRAALWHALERVRLESIAALHPSQTGRLRLSHS